MPRNGKSAASGSASAGPSSSSTHVFDDGIEFMDSPDSAAADRPFMVEPPEVEWEEVGAKKKARKAAISAHKDTHVPTASPSTPSVSSTTSSGSTASSTAAGKKPADAPKPSKGSKGKAPVTAPAAPPPPAAAPAAAARYEDAARKPSSSKKPREPTKPELQARCEELLRQSSETGYMRVDKLGDALAFSQGYSSWQAKYSKAHGPLRTFLARCPNLSVAKVGGEERVYLNNKLDELARAAIAAEKAALRAAAPRKRKGSGGRFACCSCLFRVEALVALFAAVFAVLAAAMFQLIPTEEWHGGFAALQRGDMTLTMAFLRRGFGHLARAADAWLASRVDEAHVLSTRLGLTDLLSHAAERIAVALGR